jgi:hypothetical protein
MSARVITHAVIAVAMLTAHAHAAGQISVHRSRVMIAGAPFVISGSFAIDPLAADFTAYTPSWQFGGFALREVVLRVRAHGNGVQACVAGDALGSRLVACGALPHSLEHAGAIDVAWQLHGRGASGQGRARIAWRDGAIRVDHARFELALPTRVAGAELADATVAGELAGSLSPLDLHITARARAGAIAIAGAELANVELPIDARARPGRVEATLHVRGLPLGQMLALASDNKLEGSGLLDGEVALHVDDRGVTLARGALQARASGGFRVRDAGWTTRLMASIHGVEVHRRIENALSDFAYDRLALVVRPAGTDPDATLVLHGRGKRVAQELAITINMRGVRTTARSLQARNPSLGVP